MKYLIPFFRKYRLESILAPLFKMLEASFDLLVPLVVADIIDVGIADNNMPYILSRFAMMLLLAVLGLLSSFTAQYFAAKAAVGTSTELRHNLLRHIENLDFASLDSLGSATLITRLTSDVNQVQNGLNMFLRLFLRSPFIVFGALLMAFFIDKSAALIFTAVIAVLFIIVFGIMHITNPLYKKQQKSLDRVTVSASENLNGVRVIRAFSGEKREEQSFKEKNGALKSIQTKAGKISALMNPLTYVAVNGGIILILWTGAAKVDNAMLLSGDVIALINYLSQVLVELVKLANLVVLLSKAIVSMGRIGNILDMESAMSYGALTSSDTDSYAVVFDGVSFSYPGSSENALNNISFSAKRGETIGIIGGTGSGKSTLISLIARFFDVGSGSIKLFGHDIKEWDRQALRQKISVVMQKTRLFSGTVKSNLMYGKKDASDSEMWQALDIAQASEFVRSKPGMLDSSIEQGGRNLSGGQKQRLSIARAVIARPEILILDDSSSALDYATDAALKKSLRTLPEDTTVFIVSQRASSVKHADKILVLDDGALVGMGTHEELLGSSYVYKEIYESTSKREGE